jgi:hypothetical protein
MATSANALVESTLAFLQSNVALSGLLDGYEQRHELPDESQITVQLEILRKHRVGATTFLIQYGRYSPENAEYVVAQLCAAWERCAATPWGYLDLAKTRGIIQLLAAPFATALNLYELQTPAKPVANPPGVPDADAESKEGEGPAELRAGMTWKEAAERLKQLRNQGSPWSSYNKLSKQMGCSPRTIFKAVQNTPELKIWALRQTATPKAQSFNDVVIDRTAQGREPDPADDAAIREYLEREDLTPEERAFFNGLSREDQVMFLDDPDKYDRILGREP